MEQLFPFLGHWLWFVVAGVLLFLELMAPGVFFIWLAAAAAVTGLIDMVVPMGWQLELICFAVFGLVSIFAGRAVLIRRHVLDSAIPSLNQRHHAYVGRTFVLAQAIENGMGRVRIDDTLWEVTGPDLPKGAHVKVTGVDGLRLKVVAG